MMLTALNTNTLQCNIKHQNKTKMKSKMQFHVGKRKVMHCSHEYLKKIQKGLRTLAQTKFIFVVFALECTVFSILTHQSKQKRHTFRIFCRKFTCNDFILEITSNLPSLLNLAT